MGYAIVASDPFVSVLNVIWAPFMLLLPHDHKMWASIGIYTGREDNIIWERRGPVAHVYGGDFFVTAGRSEWDPETLAERPLDLESARASFREANERFESGRGVIDARRTSADPGGRCGRPRR